MNTGKIVKIHRNVPAPKPKELPKPVRKKDEPIYVPNWPVKVPEKVEADR